MTMNHLIALLEGLEAPDPQAWLAQPPEAMRAFGKAIAWQAKQVSPWVSTSDKMPPNYRQVLASYTNALGKTRIIRARFAHANTVESDPDSEIGIYDEATDTIYDPEGWYECIDNWDDFSAIFVHDHITYWMPLPEPPKPEGKA